MEIPAHLLSSEQREDRIATLESRLRREWITFFVIDNLILIGLAAVLITGGASEATTLVVAIAGGLLLGLLILYWLKYRTGPLQREIAALQQINGTSGEEPQNANALR